MRLAATFAFMGECDLARKHATQARMLAPGFDFVEAAKIGSMSERESDLQHLIDGIVLAQGLLGNEPAAQ